MYFALCAALSSAPQNPPPLQLRSFTETLLNGGPVMIPLGICSVLVLAWIIERALRLRAATLGGAAQAERLVAAARERGPSAALELAREKPTVLASIFRPVLERWHEGRPTLEKAVEDSGSRELRALVSSLRPLTVIAVSAPLLGLLGTVIGIIIAFRDIALSNAMGKPEALAVGIAQALVTTASGLVIAIPAQAGYYWFRARIDRFRRLVEETGEKLFAVHAGRSAIVAAPASAPPPSHDPAPMMAQVAT